MVWRACIRTAVGVAVLALLPYAWGPVYQFPPAQPFTGTQLWNPYASRTGTWQRANLHAHGHAWGGVTSGVQTDQEVVDRYHELGYSVAGVSDYQRIAAHHGVQTLPVYEHGFNAGKNHQLAIGAHAVDWFDFPLWQTWSNQQYVIDRVGSKADLVGLNHPSSRGAYDTDSLRALTGYHLIEVANGPFTAEDVWDAALTAGRPVWAMANDDTHDLRDQRRSAAAWNMIDASTASTADIVSALRSGRTYAVVRTGSPEQGNTTKLAALSVEDGTVRVSLDGAPSTVEFIGRDGARLHTETSTTTAQYTFRDADPYVRTIVRAPAATLFLNPVVRWNGVSLPSPRATVSEAATWLQRAAAVAAGVALIIMWRRKRAG